jgi:signal peptidase I
VLIPFRIEGSSMEPTYRHGSVNFANRLAYLLRRPERGDVVAIRTTAGRQVMYLKRIIGLPGERLAIRNGTVFVNGAPLVEPYALNPRRWQRPEIQLAPDEYYVIGDNRRMRMEDQEFGRFKANLIVGKVLF